MKEALSQNPVLVLFIVAAIGYWIGDIKVRGFNLGVAAVLFVGLIFGGISKDIHVPEVIIFLGLAIYVYTIGLSSGPTFFSTFRKRGFTDVFFVLAMLTFSAGIAMSVHYVFDFSAASTSGLFAGSTTNTPALAGLLDVINSLLDSEKTLKVAQEAVTGYSLAYPMGVIGAIIAIQLVIKVLKVDFRKEEQELSKSYPVKREIVVRNIEVTQEKVTRITIRDLKRIYKWKIAFGRFLHEGEMKLTNWDTMFAKGDIVMVTGDEEEVQRAVKDLGQLSDEKINREHSEYDTKRIFVSNPAIAGERLSTLNISEKFSAIITRIRRGDIDILADSESTVELGDQVIIVARRRDIGKIRAFFGDSYEELSKINLLSFGLGMALGLFLGMMTFELPGGVNFKLGYAGGPIIVALILSALRRTGPLVWTLSYSANLTIRQIGLILMLAGIGVNSGHTFMTTLAQGEGGLIFLAGGAISFITALTTLIVGYKVLNIPFSFLLGMVATQPAILDFSIQKAGNKLPIIGFTLILPIAMIIKVLYVQLLYTFLS